LFTRKILLQLKAWAAKPNRKPLILRGARQVGKTSIVNTFGLQFGQYIYLNLESEQDKNTFKTNPDIHTLVQAIFLLRNQKFSERENTLLFID